MRFLSTTQAEGVDGVSFSEAAMQGLAQDGGLFVPESLPALEPRDFEGCSSLSETATRLLAPFFEGDVLADALAEICREALDFPTPVVALGEGSAPSVLELFHGPTCAFKDVGARFLAACLSRLRRPDDKTATILVATSGDTGGAVAAAFYRRPGFRVVVLYPEGLVSPRQAHQLSCWGDNVFTYSVDGNFDDCQRLVKAAFADTALRDELALNSANSINLARLLPQMAYYAQASLDRWRADGVSPGFVVPTGNLGNAFACVTAREIGLPIGDVVLATNANRPVPDFLETGTWEPRASLATLASAMDVGNPSNMERLRWMFPNMETLRSRVSSVSVTDAEIRATIKAGPERWDQCWCPHTATAVHAWEEMDGAQKSLPWILVATAHAAKFETVVEPLIGRSVDVPAPLQDLLDRPAQARRLTPDLDDFREVLRGLPASA
ncbi:MAG: threonine synthase [Gammaproteobacteria bacterium]|nr:MAG: threonine synthase [Gammaproteobacteria bacterium]